MGRDLDDVVKAKGLTPEQAEEMALAAEAAEKAAEAEVQERLLKKCGRSDPARPHPETLKLLERNPDREDEATGKVIKGSVRKTALNLQTILETDPRMKGRLRFNEFKAVIEVDGARITDNIEAALQLWLGRRYRWEPSERMISRSVALVATRTENRYHPVRSYLLGLCWDQTPRIDTWLRDLVGAEDTPINQKIGRRFLISAVARAMKPGCKVDTMLILVGEQGDAKSTAFQMLAGKDWFRDSELDIGNKDAYQMLNGVWIFEIAELASMMRPKGAEAVKAFLSSQIDHYRPSYGRHVIEQPRQLVFCGTSNEQEFLKDPTGNRRFWPVQVGVLHLEEIARLRDQLWAEAMVAYEARERWWLDKEETRDLTQQNEPFRLADTWEEKIADYLAKQLDKVVTVKQVMEDALDLKTAEQQKKPEQMRVADVLKAMGYRKSPDKETKGKVRTRYWYPPERVKSEAA